MNQGQSRQYSETSFGTKRKERKKKPKKYVTNFHREWAEEEKRPESHRPTTSPGRHCLEALLILPQKYLNDKRKEQAPEWTSEYHVLR